MEVLAQVEPFGFPVPTCTHWCPRLAIMRIYGDTILPRGYSFLMTADRIPVVVRITHIHCGTQGGR